MRNLRTTDLVIADIKSLVQERGYIYSLCMILFDDFHVNLETLHERDHKSRISIKEASLLLGFLIQNSINLSYPATSEDTIQMKARTYELLEELHFSLSTPQIEELLKAHTNSLEIEDIQEFRKNHFIKNGVIIESIFYSGDGVYDFQYLEFLEYKYKYDKEWLEENRNFDINSCINLANKIRGILSLKAKQVKLIGLQEKRYSLEKDFSSRFGKKYSREKLKEKLDETINIIDFFQYKELFPPLPKKNVPNPTKRLKEDWDLFYKNLLDLFIVNTKDLPKSSKTDSFLDNFSTTASTGTNFGYEGIGSFNIINSKPVIKLDEQSFFIPLNYLLTESIYESPFYWMWEDKSYRNELASHRGKTGEEITFNFLVKIFGEKNTFKSVQVSSKKGHDDTDIDILCILGNKALCVQVKSKKLTLAARRGDTNQLLKDFKGAIQDAYEQGIVSRDKLVKKDAKFYKEDGTELKLNESIDEVYIMGITTENYPSLTHQTDILLDKRKNDPYPIFLTIFDLELLVHYLPDPFDFLYYIRQRISLMDYFIADEEMVYLSYHLNYKLWKSADRDKILLDSTIGQNIDRNYYPLKAGFSHLLSDENDRIKNRWTNDNFDRLCNQLKSINEPKITDIIFFLLDLSGDSRDSMIENIIKFKAQTRTDGKTHSFAMPFSKSKTIDSGMCYVTMNSNNLVELQEFLLNYCVARKYKSKANIWIGFGSLLNSNKLVDYFVYNDQLWSYDADSEEFSNKVIGKPQIITKSDGEKVGRNDLCPCGSGKKYKKCCL